MRKPGFILLLLLCCLCFTAGDGKGHVCVPTHCAELTIDPACAEQWHCERICNSDLNLPRLTREVVPVQTVPASQQGGMSFAVRALQRHATGGFGTLKGTSVFHYLILSSGARAADYYVYRLRRLII